MVSGMVQNHQVSLDFFIFLFFFAAFGQTPNLCYIKAGMVMNVLRLLWFSCVYVCFSFPSRVVFFAAIHCCGFMGRFLFTFY